MISYYNPLHLGHITLSIDNVVLDCTTANTSNRENILNVIDALANKYEVEVISWESLKIGTFREQLSIKLQNGNSFWLGITLNAAKVEWNRCRLEFNPNKIASNDAFVAVHRCMLDNSRSILTRISRFDLAIDIPVPRDQCFLVKDRRKYIERRHGQEYTQYLGAKSSTVGRVKLYNKAIESKLEYPLTRLELTLDPAVPYEKVNFPTVFYLKEKQVELDGLKVTDTERFIINALLQGYGSLNDLGRKTRAKIEKLMTQYVQCVGISENDYNTILSQLRTYLE